MRVLITGVSGFTGTYLANELLSGGHEVFGLAHGEVREPGAFPVVSCDLLDGTATEAAVARWAPEAVVHLAAIAFVAHGNPSEMYTTNLLGTRQLLEVLARRADSIKSVLVASSANVYGNARAGKLDENTPYSPANDYAVSKVAMELMVRLWEGRLPVTIVRPFNYTGVGQSPSFLLPKIVNHFRSRAPTMELGNLDVVRDFSDVRTVVQCYRRILETPRSETTIDAINVCSGVGYALKDVIKMVSKIAGHTLQVTINPSFVRSNEVHTLVGSASRLEAKIGPIHSIPLDDTLEWMLLNGA